MCGAPSHWNRNDALRLPYPVGTLMAVIPLHSPIGCKPGGADPSAVGNRENRNDAPRYATGQPDP
jgi:hypothetical protein